MELLKNILNNLDHTLAQYVPIFLKKREHENHPAQEPLKKGGPEELYKSRQEGGCWTASRLERHTWGSLR